MEMSAAETAYVAITKLLKPYRAMEIEMGCLAFLKTKEYQRFLALEAAAQATWRICKEEMFGEYENA